MLLFLRFEVKDIQVKDAAPQTVLLGKIEVRDRVKTAQSKVKLQRKSIHQGVVRSFSYSNCCCLHK